MKDEEAGGGPNKKASKKSGKGSSKGNGKGKRQAGAAGMTADEQVLQRIGNTIAPMKEDFIVVHLREPCSACRKYISGEPKCVLVHSAMPLPQLHARLSQIHPQQA